MTGAPPQEPTTAGLVFKMYRAVVGVGLACGLAIVTVFEITRPIIARNKIEARQRAILDVLPGATGSAAFSRQAAGNFVDVPVDAAGELVFAGYDDAGEVVGLAIEAQGMGYQDIVRVLYGYSFDQQTVLAIRVLESRETPGLGDRVEKDAAFLRNFGELDVQLAPAGDALANAIEFVKSGTKTSAWQIDGITGATITSRAVANMLSKSTASWMPLVYSRRSEFAKPEGGPK
jgi:electron transport complex protein RnfG